MANYQFITLATKAPAKICYSFHEPVSPTKPVLLVFINGLGLPQTSWQSVISQLRGQPPKTGLPAIFTYDRFGQGQTPDTDPQDATAADPMHGHNCLEVVQDLHQLLTQIALEKLNEANLNNLTLVLVGNSIGCALIRLYSQEHPGTVSGIILLDSVLANSDFVSIYPDPNSPDFNATTLPEGVTPPAIHAAREYMSRTFHPDNGSKEGLSRKNLRDLLPASDGPQLHAPGGHRPWVTIIGHDFEAFADEFERMGGAPPSLTRAYVNPYWHRYNEGLVKITDTERSKGPLLAPGAGHFVQRDNPEFVVTELREMLEKIM
ncbi:alpha/beta-hydrolase [Aspergillus ellipticus CBS 707.79]|uniref:Alpha/beta-hydrolase n=1 Tax=Aspergillus ellipticus CBS 707.79 TaxID=1448320 RepID=A0A319DG96_9EURO|nr:alpha/beta-hydrolase [Aspergillus ellipticus CBS 707.79]